MAITFFVQVREEPRICVCNDSRRMLQNCISTWIEKMWPDPPHPNAVCVQGHDAYRPPLHLRLTAQQQLQQQQQQQGVVPAPFFGVVLPVSHRSAFHVVPQRGPQPSGVARPVALRPFPSAVVPQAS